MGTITEVIDGDTFKTDEDKLRVGYIDTPESVHTNPDRNTPEGKEASNFVKTLLPVGSEVAVVEQDRDAFGRKVSDVYRDINGTKVNMALMALDQDLTQYYTEFGKHPDVTKHEQYKEYYSKDVPYQFGEEARIDLTQEEFEDMSVKHSEFTKVQQRFTDKEATQEELDAAIVNLYGDERKVVNYRKALSNWNRPIEQEDPTSLRGAMRIAMQYPHARETYNRAIRNGHLVVKPYEKDKGFFEHMKNSLTLSTSVSAAIDMKELWVSRQNKNKLDVPESVLVEGLPPAYHSQVFDEALQYSTRSALVKRDQLIEDIANNKQFDDMSTVAQFGYGTLTALMDPLTWVPAAGIAKVGKAAIDTTKYWQVSRAIADKSHITGAETLAKLGVWTSAGGVEGALTNAPRLAADHTYTPKDYMLDTVLDAGFGGVLGAGGMAVHKGYTAYKGKAKESRKKVTDEIQIHVNNMNDPVEAEAVLLQPKEDVELFKDVEMSDETVSKWTNQPTVSVNVTDKFVPLAAVTKVSPEGMKLASQTLKDTFPDKTPIRMLINSAVGLGNKNLPEDVAEEAVKLNADILQIAAAFPTGKVPKHVNAAIQGVTFTQRTLSTNNALADILRGENVKTNTATLEGYVKSLRNKKELWGDRPITKFDSDTFIRMQSDWLHYQARVDDDALLSMRAELPKQLSYLKDLVELNTVAQKSTNKQFKDLVEELNGMAVIRMNQAEEGNLVQYSDSSKSWGKTVEMSPQEIAAQLKKEGLVPRTTEYVERMKALRVSGRAVVSEDVNRVGKLEERAVGSSVNEQSFEGEQYYTENDKQTRLAELESGAGRDLKIKGSNKILEEDLVSELEKTRAFIGSSNSKTTTPEQVAKLKTIKKRQQLIQQKLKDNKASDAEMERLAAGRDNNSTTLVKEDFEQDLLPRSFIESTSVKAFKELTVESIKALRKQLNSNVGSKLKTKVIPSKEDPAHVIDRLQKVKKNLLKDKDKVLGRMVDSRNWQSVEDVIRASQSIVADKKYAVSAETLEIDEALITKSKAVLQGADVDALEASNVRLKELAQVAFNDVTILETRVNAITDDVNVTDKVLKGKLDRLETNLEKLEDVHREGVQKATVDYALQVEQAWDATSKKAAVIQRDATITALNKQLGDAETIVADLKTAIQKNDSRLVSGELTKLEERLLDKIRVWRTSGEELAKNSDKLSEVYAATDVVRASKPTVSEVDSAPAIKALSEDEVQLVIDYTTGIKANIPQEAIQPLQTGMNDAYTEMVKESQEKVMKGLTKFDGSSEKLAWELAKKPVGLLDVGGRAAAKITEDLATKFHNSELNSLEYFGSRVTEIGKGYGGSIRRKATGGVMRDAYYKESIMQIAPQYVRIMDDYAKSQGANAWQKLKAQWQAGADNDLVKQFNREVFTVQELRRQGKPTEHVNKAVLDFVATWDKFTEYAHNKLVEDGISGFTKERRIKHYIPHVWMSGQVTKAIRQHGRDKVTGLFEKAYRSAINNGTNKSSIKDARGLAERQVDWILQQGEEVNAVDQYSPVSDSRAKERLELDTTISVDGLSILDMLDNDVINVGTKYANRVAGWRGLANSTDGMLTSQLDIDSLKANIIQEGKDKGIDTGKYEQYYDDVINMMFGRPTRGGLTSELRELKDLTALTRMGGLGMAQLIESGTVITRSTMALFSSDPVVRKVFAVAREDVKDEGLLREIQSIASITDDLEYMDRQSVHLDQAELEKVNKMRQTSLWIANKATFGASKATASRLLGKVTGYNAIRKAQSRIVQASFTVDVAKHFRDGSAKMSHARLADLGLTDADGTDVGLQKVFKDFVEYDDSGLVSKLNFDKWPKAERDRFQFAMLRDDAQQIQRTLIGEMPPWMNKPMMALAMQFRQMPIVANNKQLARSMAFADKEAVTAVMLNTALAGLVRYSKFATLGVGAALITGEDEQDPTMEQMQMSKYITQLGIYADAADLVTDAFNAGQTDTVKDSFNAGTDIVFNQVPVLGLMSDYWEAGKAGAITAGADLEQSKQEQIDAAFGLMPLGNVAMADMVRAWLDKQYGE